MSEAKDFLKELLAEHEDYMKTHELIRVSCIYSVEVPEGYDRKNPEHQEKLLRKFIKENEVEIVEHSEGKTRRYFAMKDRRVSEFDEITIDETSIVEGPDD